MKISIADYLRRQAFLMHNPTTDDEISVAFKHGDPNQESVVVFHNGNPATLKYPDLIGKRKQEIINKLHSRGYKEVGEENRPFKVPLIQTSVPGPMSWE